MRAFPKQESKEYTSFAYYSTDKQQLIDAIRNLSSRGYISLYGNIESYFIERINMVLVFNRNSVGMRQYIYTAFKESLADLSNIKFFDSVQQIPSKQ